MSEWISVKDKLPENNVTVLAYCEKTKKYFIGNVTYRCFSEGTQEYSFVNLTKGHICPCRFKTFEDAVADIEARMKQEKI